MVQSKNEVKRNSKDSVFTCLFKELENVFRLYQELHPEDKDVTLDDLHIITLENIIVNGIYNDLGFRVKDRFIILLESQSTWSMNILIRAFFYLADTYKRYFNERQDDLYSPNKVKMPEPELYLVYTKERKGRPEVISLSREFFEGRKIPLNLEMKVIYGEEKGTILGQYIAFCRVFDAQTQANKYGYTKKAMEETIRICKDQAVLNEFLKKREVELMEMMDYLYNDEIIMRNHDAQLAREARQEGRNEGISIGRNEGISIGRNEGISIGRNEGQEDLLKKILALNMLTPEQINQLRNMC